MHGRSAGGSATSAGAGLLLAWATITGAIAFYLRLDGANVVSSTLLIAAVALFGLATWSRRSDAETASDSDRMLLPALMPPVLVLIGAQLVLALVVPYRVEVPAEPLTYRLLPAIGLAGLLPIAVGFVRRRDWGQTQRRGLWLVVAMGLAYRLTIVASDIEPPFDVHTIQAVAGQALLNLSDPYLTDVYQKGYPYFPVAAIAAAIGEVFGDARWMSCAGDVLTIAGILLLARRAGARPVLGLGIAALWAWWPGSFYVTWQGFPEPILVGFLAVAAAAMAGSAPHAGRAGVLLGLAMATKQFGLGMIPFISWRDRSWLLFAAAAGVVAIGWLLPFIAWHPAAFIEGAFLSHISEAARPYALNVLNWPGVSLSVPIVLGLVIAVGFGWICQHRQQSAFSGWLAGSGGLLLVDAVLNKIGFVNYYAIPLVLILLLIVALDGERSRPDPTGEAVRT